MPPTLNEPMEIRFDGWIFLPRSGELLKNGTRKRLQDLSCGILEELVAHAGELVTREQLIARLWPKGVVDFETGLNTAMRKLRLALGEEADTPRYIETVPRKGYRFIAALEPSAPAPAGENGAPPADSIPVAPKPAGLGSGAPSPPDSGGLARRRWTRMGGVGLVVLLIGAGVFLLTRTSNEPVARTPAATSLSPAPGTLAILPFRPLLPGERNPALEMGMANTLISQLSNLPDIRVSALSSVRAFAGPEQDARLAGQKLHVDTVLEGSIQSDAQRVRVTASLLRVGDGQTIWSRQFDAPMSGIFAVQDTIATQVVAALAVTLSDASRKRLLQQGTSSVEAYQFYVSGLYNWQRRLPQAVGEFEDALRADPKYALAWVGLADALSAEGVYGYVPPGIVFPRAKAAALRAIEIAPDLPEAQVTLGHILVQYEHRYAEGERQYLAARELKQDYATGWQRLSIVRAYRGQLQAALSDMRQAQKLEPTTLNFAANIGMMLYYLRDYPKAIEQSERVLALDPRQDQALTILGRVLVETGDYESALRHFAARLDSVPGGDGDMGRAYARAGRRQEALAELERLQRRAAKGFGVAYDIATIHVGLGETAQACAALERSLADRSQLIGMLSVDPAMDPLRKQPCYTKMAQQLYGE